MTKINHSTMTKIQLEEAHSDMLATASDLGFKVPDHLLEIPDGTDPAFQMKAAKICDDLHAALEKHSADLAPSEKKPVASETEKVQGAPAKPKKTAAPKVGVAKPKAEAAKPPAAKEKTVAKKAAKKATKKSAPKKAAKKATAGTGAHALRPEGVITVKAKENPCREGSDKHERVAAIFKLNGKTVEAALKAGVRKGSLNYCKEQGWISIK